MRPPDCDCTCLCQLSLKPRTADNQKLAMHNNRKPTANSSQLASSGEVEQKNMKVARRRPTYMSERQSFKVITGSALKGEHLQRSRLTSMAALRWQPATFAYNTHMQRPIYHPPVVAVEASALVYTQSRAHKLTSGQSIMKRRQFSYDLTANFGHKQQR